MGVCGEGDGRGSGGGWGEGEYARPGLSLRLSPALPLES